MINYLRNSEIDREKWDGCLKEIPFVRPYAWSWYLDIMAPGWDALVDDDYLSVFPLPRKKKFGISYIATPVFLQQLGLFAPDGDRERIAEEFVSFIPEFYRLTDLCIGQEVKVPGYTLTPRYNYEMHLNKSYGDMWLSYMSDCRRNINIARRYPQEIVEDVKPGEIISLFRNNTAARAGVIRSSSYSGLHKLMDNCVLNGTGRSSRCKVAKGQAALGNVCD